MWTRTEQRSLSHSLILLIFSFFVLPSIGSRVSANLSAGEIELVLAKVPDGASWQSLPVEIQKALEARANYLLIRDRMAWGTQGVAEKEKLLIDSPTPAMRENIDRILSVKFAADLPGGFQLARDVSNPELKRMLLRIYLHETSSRAFLLLNHPDFGGWEGLPIREVELLDHQHIQAIAKFLTETENQLRRLPDDTLTPVERSLRSKIYFITRAGKHFSKPPVGRSGSFGISALYGMDPKTRPFASDSELLDAYNASMFSEFRDVNIGSLQSFQWDFAEEFNEAALSNNKIERDLVKDVMKLAELYRTRVLAHPDHEKPCTPYTKLERFANWDAFTAQMMTNEDGKESMEDYATAYAQTAQLRAREMQVLGRATIDALFPAGKSELSAEQRVQVFKRIDGELKPAAMIETIYAALDEETGGKAASAKLKAAIEQQAEVGGYDDGEALRPADESAIGEMWDAVRDFIKKNYSGYKIDIATLIPNRPKISTTDETCFAIGGDVSIGLKNKWYKASLYSTVMHEIKHAIDQKSGSAVEGAAWEGAAVSIERQVWPLFIGEVMGGGKAEQVVAQLVTAVDNVRFTATTDATLKIFLREGNCEPDSFEFAKQIVAGYGYTDPKILTLRAKRANASTQYLEYDYGLVQYLDLLNYLQAGIGAGTRVDAYLLQACGMPSPKKIKRPSIDSRRRLVRDGDKLWLKGSCHTLWKVEWPTPSRTSGHLKSATLIFAV